MGLGWRRELAADLLASPEVVDFVEVVAESCYVQAKLRREAVALSRLWPVALHGVKLSLGSAEGLDDERARQLGALARELRPPVISEHVAFTRGRSREIGHLTPLPRTREAVAVVARNVARARRFLPDVPLLLENVAATFGWPDDEMDEASFYQEVVAATDCALLLDLGNLWANAINEGLDPHEVLRRMPLERVAMVHLAGGEWDHGFYLDTHAAPVGEPVLGLLGALTRWRGPVPVLLERDAGFGPFEALRGELERIREVVATDERETWDRAPWSPSPEVARGGRAPAWERLADEQHALAQALTALDEPSPEMVGRFGAEPLRRTRAVLARKRVDDSLPLLPRTAAKGEPARSLAMAAVEREPRAPQRAAIADALRIAAAAAVDPVLSAAGRVDQLILRARFVGPDRNGVVRPRRGPFVGRARVDERRACWVVKGPGSAAAVRLFERGGP